MGAALTAIGREADIWKTGMMWQAWPCRSAMHNFEFNMLPEYNNTPLSSNLSSPADFCVHIFDMAGGGQPRKLFSYNELAQEMLDAKARGHLFARKFTSSDTFWADWIQNNVHAAHAVSANGTSEVSDY
jgi:hypothetical protein